MARSVSDGRKGQYAKYKNNRTWEKNRIRKLERLIKEDPNNFAQYTKALSSIVYRRKAPKTKAWNYESKRFAQLKKLFTKGPGYSFEKPTTSFFAISQRVVYK